MMDEFGGWRMIERGQRVLIAFWVGGCQFSQNDGIERDIL
jgi:hypothetical protein